MHRDRDKCMKANQASEISQRQPRRGDDSGARDVWDQLLGLCDRMRFEPHQIEAQLDARGCYEVALEDEFPLLIKLFHYTSRRHTRGATWHD